MPANLLWGDRVTTCDCLLTGRVNFIWHTPAGAYYYRVQFPPGSPFIDDWAVYRQNEVARRIDRPPLINLNVVDAMRPKFPSR